jgi:cell division protein FtsB
MGRNPFKSPWVRWAARGAVAVALAFAFGYLPYRVYGGAGLGRLGVLQRELHDLKARNQVTAAENARLREEVHALRHDLGAVERVAREELGLVKPGDVVFQIEEAKQ